jgi:hypothetical protein
MSTLEEVETVPLRGVRVTWTGINADELASVAGNRFAGTDGNDALVRGIDGVIVVMEPGWCYAAWENGEFTIGPRHASEVYARVRS